MDSEKVDKLRALLNEEKWTRTPLSNYTLEDFEEFDKSLQETDEETRKEIGKIADEHLEHSKDSIIALYISGIIAASMQSLDDSNMLILIGKFKDKDRLNIVEHMCEKTLEYSNDNIQILKELAECYENLKDDDKKIATWEQIVKKDHEEAEIAKSLAEYYEKAGNNKKALDFYQKALHRFTSKKLFTNVKEIWIKLIQYDDYNFFISFIKKANKVFPAEKIIELLEYLYDNLKKSSNWDNCIEILKLISNYDIKNEKARKEIIFCYTQKYSTHSQLDKYIAKSNLPQSWKNITEAIADFEKYISFDAGNFVLHRNWGIGRIKEMKGENIIIDFLTKRGHSMGIDMAVTSLTMLPKDHIRVIKATSTKAKLNARVKDTSGTKEDAGIAWTLKTIIKSHDNAANLKTIKDELVPDILTVNEWTSWSAEAKKELSNNPVFGPLDDRAGGLYEVRTTPITKEEKDFNNFKCCDKFFDKIKILQGILEHETDGDFQDSDYIYKMTEYFNIFLKQSTVDENVLSSYLILSDIKDEHKEIKIKLEKTFKDLIAEIPLKDIKKIFKKIENDKLRRVFLNSIRKNIPTWADYFCELFPVYLQKDIPETLIREGFTDKVKKLFQEIIDSYKEVNFREAFIWLCNHGQEFDFYNEIKLSEKDLITKYITLLDNVVREINGGKNPTANKKLNRDLQNFLFKDAALDKFIAETTRDNAKNIIMLLRSVDPSQPKIFDPNKVQTYEKIATERFQDIKFSQQPDIKKEIHEKINVTLAKMNEKQQELTNIKDVEMPQNAKEIGEAIALGDLSENYEYKSAREKQRNLAKRLTQLEKEISESKIFDPKNVNTKTISFGTVASFINLDTGDTVEYTILGPWESKPEDNIISYLSPLGKELCGAAKNKKLKFKINDTEYNYKVISIVKSDLI